VIERIDYSGELCDRESLAERLHGFGLAPAAALGRAGLFARAAADKPREVKVRVHGETKTVRSP